MQRPDTGAGASRAPPRARWPRPDPRRAPDFEEIFRTAARHHEAERYWDAIQLLEPVVEKAPGKLGSACKVVLARCYLKNPNWSRRAEETLLDATRSDPASVEAWVLLASIYAEKSMRNRACSMYRKVLELRPEHDEAAVTWLPTAPRKHSPATEDSSGVLRRLFRRS